MFPYINPSMNLFFPEIWCILYTINKHHNMKTLLIKSVFCCIACLFFVPLHAQNIVIDDSLAANSQALSVKIGGQGFGKISKWKFGEYAVVWSKSGWIKTDSRSNLFNTKTESKTTQKISFILCNQASDSAVVNAAKDIIIETAHGLEITRFLTFGEDELKLEALNFMATININGDTTDTWVLMVNSERGTESNNTGNGMLTNGTQSFKIVPASSNKNGTDKRLLPAEGYELLENDLSAMALQYYGGGALGLNKNKVWIDNRLDPKIKLILAAAATALMQLKLDEYAAAM